MLLSGLPIAARQRHSCQEGVAVPPFLIQWASGIDADQLLDYLRDKMNVTLAEGQDQLKGKAIRIAHIGYMGAFDVITAIAALEMALRKFGAEIPFGRGVAAAEEVLMEALV